MDQRRASTDCLGDRRRENALGYVGVVVPFLCDDGDTFNSNVWRKDVIVRSGQYDDLLDE
jgi:hypothetical protein